MKKAVVIKRRKRRTFKRTMRVNKTQEVAATRLASNVTFSYALEKIKHGSVFAREGWNGKGMFIFLVAGSVFNVNRKPLLGIFPEGTEVNYRGHIDMRTADGSIVPWLASQTDLLADDWQEVGSVQQ